MTLYDMGMKVVDIQKLLDAMEVKGKQNASLLVQAFDACNEIIEAINAAAMAAQENQNGSQESEINGG